MKKEMFYRKCSNIEEYDNLLTKYPEYFDLLEYNIIKRVRLSRNEFINFINDFSKPQTFLKENLNLMTMDSNDKISCISVWCDVFNYSILVYSAGYNYARYIAKTAKSQNN